MADQRSSQQSPRPGPYTTDRTPRLPALDGDVPALVLKVGRYPIHHGGLGAVRSLGRAGVPTYAVIEDPHTPLARSRLLTGVE